MLIGSGIRSRKSEVRGLKSGIKTHYFSGFSPTAAFRLQTSLPGSYIYSGKCNFFVVNSLIQKTNYESPKNSPGLCYPDDGAFIL